MPDLVLFLIKGADHTASGQIFPCNTQHRIQRILHFFIERNTHKHNPEHHYREQRDCHHKNQRRLHINCESHNHRAEHDKRGTEKQTQHQIDAVLYLIDIACHAGDQR